MENPYTQNDNSKLLDSFVCYADILGFSEISRNSIANGTSDQFLDQIRKALNQAYTNIRKEVVERRNVADFSLKVFTDNIVIGFPVQDFLNDKGEPELGVIFQILSEFQINLAMEGFFVRGGIAYGKHYMDDDIVFGDALIESHELDAKGCPPRIVLSKKVVELVHEHIGFYNVKESSPQYYDLLQDPDGTYFLNYLKEAFAIFPDGNIFFGVLDAHKNEIINNLNLFKNKPYIRQKYEWLGRYHNFICEEVANDFPLSDDPDQPPEHAIASQSAQKTLDYLINADAIPPSRIILPIEGAPF